MEPPADVPPEHPYRCPRCGAPHDPYQEYCLECGARLARYYPQSRSVWRREMWTRESPLWFLAAFAALLLGALVAGAIVLAATNDEEGGNRRAQRGQTTVALPPATDVTTPTLEPTATIQPPTATTVPTFETATTRTTTTGTTTTTTGTTTTLDGGGGGTVIAWPTGRRGYTVVLASLPAARGREAAEAKAEQAIDAGLTEVGVLNSSDYSSLRQGYWVVFSGVHDTVQEAREARAEARSAGYPLAYPREISP